ncbi:hypothetical protein N0V90_012799, partial [Kalmusia sp. IMI 367209]
LSDWPTDGEIDIIENVNDARTNNAAIHAMGNCTVTNTANQTGLWKSTDCSIDHDENQGCGTVFTEPYNYGTEFNANGGGVYAMEWTLDSIRVWFFPPTNVPFGLTDGGIPDSAMFGLPSASFSGPCSASFGEKFFNHSIVIDTTFCGGWAGGTFGTGTSSCPTTAGLDSVDSCISYVANNPEAFKDAYWGIKSLKVWEKVPGFTLPELATPSVNPFIEPVSVLIKEPIPENTLEPIVVDVSPSTGGILTISVGEVATPTSSPDTLIVLSSELVPEPTTESGPLDVSPLTGGVLTEGNETEGASTTDEDETDVLFHAESVNNDILTTDLFQADLGASTVSESIAFIVPTSTAEAIPSVAKVLGTPSLRILPAIWNTESHTQRFPPELSFPVPTKRPLPPNGNTGVVLAQLQGNRTGRLPMQNSSAVINTISTAIFPSGAPLSVSNIGVAAVPFKQSLPLLPPSNSSEIIAIPSALIPGTHTINLLATHINAPLPTGNKLPLLFPATGDEAGVQIPGLDIFKVDIPSTSSVPISFPSENIGISALVTPNGNTGIVPPTVSNNAVSNLWCAFAPDVKEKILSAVKNLPSPLPRVTDAIAFEISDTVNAPLSTATPTTVNLPMIPPIVIPPPLKPAGGLLGFLDAKTKNTLKSGKVWFLACWTMLQQEVSRPPQFQLLKVPPDNVPAANSPASIPSQDLQMLYGLLGLSKPQTNALPLISNALPQTPNALPQMPNALPQTSNALPQVPSPVLSLVPDVPVTALNTTDTNQAMTGLLSFLDDNTKAQIVDLLIPDDGSTAAVLRQGVDPLDESDEDDPLRDPLGKNIHHPEFDDFAGAVVASLPKETWATEAATLSDDTKSKLDDIIKKTAGLSGAGVADVTGNILDVLKSGEVLPLKDEINAIDEDDKKKLSKYLTGDSDFWVASIKLVSLFSDGLAHGGASSYAGIMQNIIDSARLFVDTPNDESREVFWETVKDGVSSVYGDANSKPSKRNRALHTRQTSSIWTAQDKYALALNIYGLCPSPELIGIPFPSRNDLAISLLDPKTTLEAAVATFQRKLEAYFDVTVQGCWIKINQWLAWRQLLRAPGTVNIPPFPIPPLKRLRARQDDSEDDAGGLLEQQIYAICPKPDAFSATDLIADLEDPNTTLEISISKFQNRLWAYMAKLQSCSDQIRTYGPKLKSFIDNNTTSEPVLPTDDATHQLVTRQDQPHLGGLSAGDILDLLSSELVGFKFWGLSPEEQKSVFSALIAGFNAEMIEASVAQKGNFTDLALALANVQDANGDSERIRDTTGLPGSLVDSDNSSGASIDNSPNDNNPDIEIQDTSLPNSDLGDNTSGADLLANRGPVDCNSLVLPPQDIWPPNSRTSSGSSDGTSEVNLPADGATDGELSRDSQNTATQDTAPSTNGSLDDEASMGADTTPPSDALNDDEPTDTQANSPSFYSRIQRAQHSKRQKSKLTYAPEDNGIIPDADTPADLDEILGKHGTLDPYGMLASENDTTDDDTPPSNPHDRPAQAYDDDDTWELPSSSVDEASPDVDQIVDELGELDPFGQLGPRIKPAEGEDEGDTDEDKVDTVDSSKYFGKLKDYECDVKKGKYMGDSDFEDEFLDKYFPGGQGRHRKWW